MSKTALVCGAGGFIGSHLVRRLKTDGYFVIGVDLKEPEFSKTVADHFAIADLRHRAECAALIALWSPSEIYQLAADMGGAGFVFTGANDADIMHNSAQINLNIADIASKAKCKVFYSSSACMYPAYNQEDPLNPKCSEDSAYPAAPDSEYGWEKLFSERLYLAYARNHGLDVRIARFHNIYGPEGTYKGGREKAPAAICRKVIEAENGGEIEIWGDGTQTRSFLYVDECVEGILRLMASDFKQPVNIGSDEMITINDLAKMAIEISGKQLTIKNIAGPVGVNGRNSDNALIKEKLGWAPDYGLRKGMERTFEWVLSQISRP